MFIVLLEENFLEVFLSNEKLITLKLRSIYLVRDFDVESLCSPQLYTFRCSSGLCEILNVGPPMLLSEMVFVVFGISECHKEKNKKAFTCFSCFTYHAT